MLGVPQRARRVRTEIVELAASAAAVRDGFTLVNREQVEADMETSLLISFEGPAPSPFAGRSLTVSVGFPPKYPFEPPTVTFSTPVYHPNIDGEGHICLDLLRLPPRGAWRPTVSLGALLGAIRILLAEPNPDDPLVSEIAREFTGDHELYVRKAREYQGSVPGQSKEAAVAGPADGGDEPSGLLSLRRGGRPVGPQP